MDSRPSPASPFDAWLAALDERHLADFRPAEVGRALRALSSCYVERRSRLAEGGALETAGKRAAFALFYAPLHFLTADRVVSALPSPAPVTEVLDLGCGTGAAGAAWALQCAAGRISGFDRHPWAVAEANWTYRVLGLQGRALPAGPLARPPRARARPRHPRGLHHQRAARRPPERLADASCSTRARAAPQSSSSNPSPGGWRRGGAAGRTGSSPPADGPTNGASMSRCPLGSGNWPDPPASIRASCGRGACSRDRIVL